MQFLWMRDGDILTFMPDFHMLPAMKTMFQVRLNGRVPAPAEQQFDTGEITLALMEVQTFLGP